MDSPKPPSVPKFSKKYRAPLICGGVWAVLLLFFREFSEWGDTFRVDLSALGAYGVLLLLIMLRRPAAPTRLDCILIGWSLPILYLIEDNLIESVWEYLYRHGIELR